MSKILPENLTREHKYWRIVEMIPGLCTWAAFFLVFFGSIFFPIITADLIIAYTLIWVFRTFLFSYNLTKSFHYSQRAQKTNWNKLLELLENPEKLSSEADTSFDSLILGTQKGSFIENFQKQIVELQAGNNYLKPSEVTHCITLCNANESYEVIKTSVESYVKNNFDLKKVILILACEEAFKEQSEATFKLLHKEYGHHFKDFFATFHPPNLPDELKGRAGNATWSAKRLKEYLDKHQLDYNKVILSSFDADTVISPSFLSELTFRYCITPNRIEVGYQPVPFYHNNIWDVPVFNRLVAISCSFWQVSVSLRKDENKSFSSRSMSFQSVLDFGYWDARVV
ncbi:hypothetical protein IT411_00920, partial [Candidatus Peregrinibacteria bacterium]|nr:hypothetical protein [Candidatus Peregrinibacteria bacterium]